MSGTSLDGIDAALVLFKNGKVELIDCSFTPYPQALEIELHQVSTGRSSASLAELLQLDHQIGRAFAKAAQPLTRRYGDQIVAIGSHGQTIFHAPEHGNSWQLGDPNVIAETTGITTVADFRRRDIASGGQGAPLTPAFHASQFSGKAPKVVLNLGGIANITYLPGAPPRAATLGFDTGPANTLMDQWINKIHARTYDENGDWARQGAPDQELLEVMLSDLYFKQAPPKSTGPDYFNLDWLSKALEQCSRAFIAPQNIQATLLQLTARTVIESIEKHAPDATQIILCGGGAKNNALVEQLIEGRPDSEWMSSNALGIDSDYLEAIAFAWLARQAIKKIPLDLRHITGAKHPAILGAIYPGKCE